MRYDFKFGIDEYVRARIYDTFRDEYYYFKGNIISCTIDKLDGERYNIKNKNGNIISIRLEEIIERII